MSDPRARVRSAGHLLVAIFSTPFSLIVISLMAIWARDLGVLVVSSKVAMASIKVLAIEVVTGKPTERKEWARSLASIMGEDVDDKELDDMLDELDDLAEQAQQAMA